MADGSERFMGASFRIAGACVLAVLTALTSNAQDLPPALAQRFSQGVAEFKAGQLDRAEAAFREVLRSGGGRAFVHHNLGLVLRERGRNGEALAEFRAAITLDPAFGPARLLAGTTLLTLARPGEARVELERAARLMPREPVAYVQLADACERLDDRRCVVDAYRTLVQLAPADPEYAYRLGLAYLDLSQWAHERLRTTAAGSARLSQALAREYRRQGNTDLAVRALQRAADADGTLPDIHLALAETYLDEGRLEDASTEIQRELTIVPSGKDALDLKTRIDQARRTAAQSTASAQDAVPASSLDIDAAASLASASAARRDEISVALSARDWVRAERLLADEIEGRNSDRARTTDSRALLILLARVFFVDGKPLNAAVALKKAEAIAPLDDASRFTLVLAYIRLGRGDWARPELDRLVQSNPDRAEYRYWLGRLEFDAGKYADAIARFNEALARDPQFMRAHDNLGLCYEALDDVPKAIEHYREALRLNRGAASKSPWPPTNLAILLRQRGEVKDAESLLREAVGYDSRFAKGHYELGVLLDQQQRVDEAVQELTKAAAADPAYADPHYVLARIYRRQGQAVRADDALATFKRLSTAPHEDRK